MENMNHEIHIVDFESRRVIKTLKQGEYFDDVREWAIRDNVELLDFSVKATEDIAVYLQQQNIVLKEISPSHVMAYVITETDQASQEGVIKVFASGMHVNLRQQGVIKPQLIKTTDCRGYMNIALQGTEWEIGRIEAEGKHEHTVKTFQDPVQFLKDTSDIFGNLELQFRATVKGGQLHRLLVDMVVRRGRVTGKEVTLGKDLNGIRRVENSEAVCTHLIPFLMGQDDEGKDKLITIESENNGEIFITSPEAFKRWNINGKPRYGLYTPETDNMQMSPARLFSLGKQEFKRRIEPHVSYEVDAIDVHNVLGFEHEKIEDGDEIKIIDEGMTPTLYLEARYISGKSSSMNPESNIYNFGRFREIKAPNEQMYRIYQQLMTALKDKVPQSVIDAIEEQVKDANDKAIEAGKQAQQAKEDSATAVKLAEAIDKFVKENTVEIIYSPTAPTKNLIDGKTLWFNTTNNTLYLWKDKAWKAISVSEDAVEQLKKDAEKLTEDLNNLHTQVDQTKKDIQTLGTNILALPDKKYVDDQVKDKADKSGVFTKEEIKEGYVGKQEYTTDKDGNIKQFKEVNTKVEQNAEAIKNSATKTELKQVNEDVVAVDKKVTTAQQDANGAKFNIEQLTTTFNNAKVGSTNLILLSDYDKAWTNAPATINDLISLKVSNREDIRNKEIVISAYFSGLVTSKGDKPWLGIELAVTYVDGTQAWFPVSELRNLALNKQYNEQQFYSKHKIPDKEIKSMYVTLGNRNHAGTMRLHHVQLETGSFPSSWAPAPEDMTSNTDFVKKTNEIINTVDENSAKLTEVSAFVSPNANIIRNAVFDGMDYWNQYQNITISKDKLYNGYNSQQNIQTGLTENKYYGAWQGIDWSMIEVGKQYTGSVWVMTDDPSTIDQNGALEIIALKKDGTRVFTASNSFVAKDMKAGVWYQLKATTPAINAEAVSMSMSCRLWRNGRLWVAMPQLEEGKAVTAFKPSHLDGEILKTRTNEIKQTLDGTVAKVTSVEESIQRGADNLLVDSSANKVTPRLYDDDYFLFNKSIKSYAEDFLRMTCVDDTDAFYQIGNTWTSKDAMHGISIGDNITISGEFKGTAQSVDLVIFYRLKGGTGWYENLVKKNAINADWQKISYSAKIPANVVAWFARIRFTRGFSSNTKAIDLRRLQVELGEYATPWKQSAEDIITINNKTNEIKQGLDENSATITQINAQGFVGANLIENSTFKELKGTNLNDPAKWTNNGTNTTTVQMPWDDEPRANVVKFLRSGETVNNIASMESMKVTAVQGEDYTFSLWVKCPKFDTWDIKNPYIIQFFNSAGTRVQFLDVSITAEEAEQIKKNQWTRIVRTAKATTAGIAFVNIRTTLFRNGELYVRMPQVERGTMVTGWSYARNDFADAYSTDTKINSIVQTADKTQSTISDIQKTQGTQGTAINNQEKVIQSHTSQFTQMSKLIEMKVTSQDIADYVGGVGTQNMLLNSAFEDREFSDMGVITKRTPSMREFYNTHGTVAGTAIVAPQNAPDAMHDNYNGVMIMARGLTADSWVGFGQMVPVTAGQGDITFSAWIKTNDLASIDANFNLELKYYNGNTVVAGVQKSLNIKPQLVEGKWTFCFFTMPVPNTRLTSVSANIWLQRNGTAFVSQPMLQFSSKPSAFMENTKELVAYDNIYQNIALKVATADYDKKMSTIETQFKQTKEAIDLKATATNVYTKSEANGQFGSKTLVEQHEATLKVQANEISLRVKNNEIASQINQTAQSVLIQASKIMLDGYVEAKHLKAQRLEGVTIATLPTNSKGNYMELNQQNLVLKGWDNNKLVSRGYLGFMPNLPNNTVRTALVLGNDYNNANALNVKGALFIEHKTPAWNNYDLTDVRIGMADSRASDGSIAMTTFLKMGYMGSVELASRSDIKLFSQGGGVNVIASGGGLSSITLNAQQYIANITKTGSFDIYNNTDALPNKSSILSIRDNRVKATQTPDIDMVIGDSIMFRYATNGDYNKYGLQVKTGADGRGDYGKNLANMQVAKLYANQIDWSSSREFKTNITDIKVDILETLMSLKPKQYHLIDDISKYNEDRNKAISEGNEVPELTDDEVPLNWGFISEEVPEVIAGYGAKSVRGYALTTLGIAGTQEVYKKHVALEGHVEKLTKKLESAMKIISQLQEALLGQN
ncbi:phage tail spike protein [Bacillus cereus]|uniref:phage tail spike protein n=1 Tax=Bacillus cereus TaxID=1396 RepID=UPI0024BC27ED|nr:phage tail spike protein [Bacillus cereus]